MDLRKKIEELPKIFFKRNPYPEDIFLPISDEKIREYVGCLKKNGYSSESIHGNWGRHVWKMCIEDIEKYIQEEILELL